LDTAKILLRAGSKKSQKFCESWKQKDRHEERSLRNSIKSFDQAALRFLRQPSRPSPARPPTKSGSAEGKGTAARDGSGGSALPSPWLFWFSPPWLF
jgi:hypothetical protein